MAAWQALLVAGAPSVLIAALIALACRMASSGKFGGGDRGCGDGVRGMAK